MQHFYPAILREIQSSYSSGDHGRADYDGECHENYLNSYDVPDSDIFLDHMPADTYDGMIRAKSIFQVDKAIVFAVSLTQSHLHLGRNLGMVGAVM
jgi:vancomycin permeability regulator SanA